MSKKIIQMGFMVGIWRAYSLRFWIRLQGKHCNLLKIYVYIFESIFWTNFILATLLLLILDTHISFFFFLWLLLSAYIVKQINSLLWKFMTVYMVFVIQIACVWRLTHLYPLDYQRNSFTYSFLISNIYGCASKRLSVIQRPWKVQFIDCICLKPTIVIILSET